MYVILHARPVNFIIVFTVIVFGIDIRPKYGTKFDGHYY